MGWDKLLAGRSVRAERWSLGVLALTLVLLSAVTLGRDRVVAAFEVDVPDVLTRGSPRRFDAAGAVRNLQHALMHGAFAWAAVLALVHCSWRWPRLAAPAAMVFLTLDLAIANRALVVTVPQAAFDRKPKVLELIEQAERKEPARGPFRIHRPIGWSPARLALETNAPDEERLCVRLELVNAHAQGWHSLRTGIHVHNGDGRAGGLHLVLLPVHRRARSPGWSEGSISRPIHPLVYYPRRGFDLWNTRYFILPTRLRWDNPVRGFASLLEHTQQIVPDPTAFSGPEGKNRKEDWSLREDWALLRNEQAFPRAWVVHRARRLEPSGGQRTCRAAGTDTANPVRGRPVLERARTPGP